MHSNKHNNDTIYIPKYLSTWLNIHATLSSDVSTDYTGEILNRRRHACSKLRGQTRKAHSLIITLASTIKMANPAILRHCIELKSIYLRTAYVHRLCLYINRKVVGLCILSTLCGVRRLMQQHELLMAFRALTITPSAGIAAEWVGNTGGSPSVTCQVYVSLLTILRLD